MSFAKNLSLYRKARLLKQAELAKALGVKQYTVSNWEHGKREPSIGDLIKLSRLLNVSIDALVGMRPHFIDTERDREIEEILLDPYLLMLANELRDLEEDERKRVIRSLKRMIREKAAKNRL